MLYPFIIGSGSSGKAIKNALSIVRNLNEHLQIQAPIQIGREQSLSQVITNPENSILFIANPHGLHSARIVEADSLGLKAIISEKPICTSSTQLEQLLNIVSPVFVLHVYRQTWGIQTLKQIIKEGSLGKVFAIESRYWQSSNATRALSGQSNSKEWKNDPNLSSEADVLIDLLPHQLDLFTYLLDDFELREGSLKKFFVNSDSSYLDTHLHLNLEFSNGACALGSVSKTVHGAGNQLEVNVLGSKGSALWSFDKPDYIVLGKGNRKEIIARENKIFASEFSPHHSMGWIEGYIEIIKKVVNQDLENLPSLQDALKVMKIIFSLNSPKHCFGDFHR